MDFFAGLNKSCQKVTGPKRIFQAPFDYKRFQGRAQESLCYADCTNEQTDEFMGSGNITLNRCTLFTVSAPSLPRTSTNGKS